MRGRNQIGLTKRAHIGLKWLLVSQSRGGMRCKGKDILTGHVITPSILLNLKNICQCPTELIRWLLEKLTGDMQPGHCRVSRLINSRAWTSCCARMALPTLLMGFLASSSASFFRRAAASTSEHVNPSCQSESCVKHVLCRQAEQMTIGAASRPQK